MLSVREWYRQSVLILSLVGCFALFSLPDSLTAADDSTHAIVAHRAEIQLFPPSRSLRVRDTLTVERSHARASSWRFSLAPVYNVSMLTLEGKSAAFRRYPTSVEVDLPSGQSRFRLVIEYEGNFRFRSDASQFSSERAIIWEKDLLPHGHQQLSFTRLAIIVPDAWQAVAAGELVVQNQENGHTRFVWEISGRVPSLGWMCAGIYHRHHSSAHDGVTISLFAFPEDSANAASLIPLAHEALTFFSTRFIPYRFRQLSLVQVDDWLGGPGILAAAVPGMILLKRTTLHTDDPMNQAATILPHEIAHQWWPYTVFIDEMDVAFLSEGLCEYAAFLFNEERGTLSPRDSLNNHPLLRALVTRAEQGNDLPLRQKVDLRLLPTHYLKGMYVHHMLRRLVGDSAAYLTYREFCHRYALQHANLDNFAQIAESISGNSLEWFFDQWVRNKGIPRFMLYNVRTGQIEGRWRTAGRVRVVGYEQYTTFVPIGVETEVETVVNTFWIGRDTAAHSPAYRHDIPFEIFTETKPRRAILDPLGDVLKIRKLPPKFQDLREPTDGVMIIGTLARVEHLHATARRDSAFLARRGWSIILKPDTAATLRDLQGLRVFLYGGPHDNSVARDHHGRFDIPFRGDSVVIDETPIYDRTLTFYQIIENPFRQRGLIAWIVPFSEGAESELLPFDASWILLRQKDTIASGVWEVRDDAVEVWFTDARK